MSERMYVGTKIIQAKAMTEREYAQSMGGYQKDGQPDRPGYRVRYADGYLSWSPKEPFEEAYREITDAEKLLMAQGRA